MEKIESKKVDWFENENLDKIMRLFLLVWVLSIVFALAEYENYGLVDFILFGIIIIIIYPIINILEYISKE